MHTVRGKHRVYYARYARPYKASAIEMKTHSARFLASLPCKLHRLDGSDSLQIASASDIVD